MKRGQAVCCSCFDIRALVYFCAYVLCCGGSHKTRITKAHTVARMSGKSKQGEQGCQKGGKGGAGVCHVLALLACGVWSVLFSLRISFLRQGQVCSLLSEGVRPL